MPHITLPLYSTTGSSVSPSSKSSPTTLAFLSTSFPRPRLLALSLLSLLTLTLLLSSPLRSNTSIAPLTTTNTHTNHTPTFVFRTPEVVEYKHGSVGREAEVPWYETPLLEKAGVWAQDGVKKQNGMGSWWWSWLRGGGDRGLDTVVEHVPMFPRTVKLNAKTPEARNMMFGMATTAERASTISHTWPHWLSPARSHPSAPPPCLVLLPASDFVPSDPSDPTSSPASRLHTTLSQTRDVTCLLQQTTLPHTERYEVRYFSLVREMAEVARKEGRLEEVDWWVVGDDDTFWVDLKGLRRELGRYDPNTKYLIGARTEAKAQFEAFGPIAYGGGGIIVSRAQFLAMDGIYETCVEELKEIWGGDGMFTRCAAKAMGGETTWETVVTPWEGLHQFDVPGDATGFLQSGLQWISLHHMWHGWTDPFPDEHPTPGIDTGDADVNDLMLLTKAAKFLGGDNFFRRFVFGGGKELVTLGYSVTVFEEPMVKEDLQILEYTWSYDEFKLLYPHRPQITEAPTGTEPRTKNTYYLTEVIVEEEDKHGKVRALLRHTDRWGRVVDLVWDEREGGKRAVSGLLGIWR